MPAWDGGKVKSVIATGGFQNEFVGTSPAMTFFYGPLYYACEMNLMFI